jgi:glycosyltransferase involved in cell wall biosynthesis
MKISAIVCAYNEAEFLPACLHSLFSQTRPPDEVIVVNNASSDNTAAVAAAIPGVHVVDEPVKGLVVAREAGRRQSTGHVLAYVDADCRAPLQWLERIERRFERHPAVVAVTGPYRFYDWDFAGRLILRAYDAIVAPPTHILVHYFVGAGAILYGGNFAAAMRSIALAGSIARSSFTARTPISGAG